MDATTDTTFKTSTASSTGRGKAILVIKFMLFTASIVPAIVAGAMAYSTGSFSLISFILAGLGLLIGQAGGDYLYYYFTHRHTDPRDSHTKIFSGWKPFFTSALPEKHGTLIAGIVCLLLDLAIGYYFFTQYGITVLLLALAGGLVAIFFTPLMLRGLKEPVVFVTFGPLSMLGMYFVMTGELSYLPLLVSLPVASLVTIVAYLKGAKFDVKQEGDSQVIVNLNRKVIIYLTVLAYLSLIALVATGIMPVWTLAGLLTLPVAFSVLQVIRKESSKMQDYLWAVVRSIFALLFTGILIGIGYLI